MSRTPTRTPDIVRSALTIIQPLARDAAITIETDFDPSARPIVANPGQIERAVLNLLTNAIKFTPAQGTITISIRQHDSHQQICVKDTGIGIPEDEIPRLFTRFFRSSSSLEQAIPGTGLGLAITQDIVASHGGTIAAWSHPEGGTTFEVLLPT